MGIFRIYPGVTLFDKALLRHDGFRAVLHRLRKKFYFEDEYFDRVKRRYVKNTRPLINLKACSFPTGLWPYMLKPFESIVDPDEVMENFLLPEGFEVHIPFKGVQLRGFQEEIFDRVSAGWGRGIFLIPTGSGKTLVEISLAISFWRSFRRSVYIISPRRIINDQIQDALTKALSPEDYPHNIHVVTDRYFSTMDSIDPDGLIIWDEVHVSRAKVNWSSLLKSPVKYRYGFTATLPESYRWRVIGAFGPVLVKYHGVDAVKKGWIEKPAVVLVRVRHEGLGTDLLENWDSWGSYVSEILWRRRELLFRYVEKLVDMGRKVLILVTEVERQLIPLVKELECPFIHGALSHEERDLMKKRFMERSVLVATYGTFQLGVDIPEIDTIIMACPTKSEVRILQSLGRALRRGSAEKMPLLIFFVDQLPGLWEYEKHLKKYIKKEFKDVVELREVKEVVSVEPELETPRGSIR